MQELQEETVRKMIRYFGNITKMANTIGVSRTSIYRYLEGSPIPEYIARRIDLKSAGKFSYKTLIPWKIKYHLELGNFPSFPMELPLKRVVIPAEITQFPDQKGIPVPNQRAICVDPDNHLIYGLEALEACQQHDKKMVLAWRLSLFDLANGQYAIDDFTKAFDLIERTTIGMYLEKCIGNRQGQRRDLMELVGRLPTSQIPRGSKTRTVVTRHLGLSDKNYRYIKKIIQYGDPDIMRQVRNRRLAVSQAVTLVAPSNSSGALNHA